MAEAVENALTKHAGRLAVEAGTGTGKSLAYLLAGLLTEKQVVVSTATKNLQDQLYLKDVPLALSIVEEMTGQQKTVCLMKGRKNYLCHLRFDERMAQGQLTARADKAFAHKLSAWLGQTETGDRAEIEGLADDDPRWGDVDAGAETCLGQKCPVYEDCFVTKMRRKAEGADLVVVNHHLLCADRALRLRTARTSSAHGDAEDDDAQEAFSPDDKAFAQVIPSAEAWIIDEAHALENVATMYFGVQITQTRLSRLTKDAAKIAAFVPTSERSGFARAVDALPTGFQMALDAISGIKGREDRIRLNKKAREDCARAASGLRDGIKGLQRATRAVLTDVEDESVVRPTVRAEKDSLLRRLSDLQMDLDFVLSDAAEKAGYVTWAEKRQRTRALSSAPVDVAAILDATLFATRHPVILTSATLAVGGSMDATLTRLGFFDRGNEFVEEGQGESSKRPLAPALILDPPFDYAEKSALYLPAKMPEPNSGSYEERFDEEVRFMVDLAAGGTFLLFTSYRAMDGAWERLYAEWTAEGYALFKQGQRPRAHLLDAFKAAEEKGQGAILFGTSSFWEGVDVRGHALRVVAIDKLPFKSPADPIFQARKEFIEARRGSAFRELSLPEAALSLKQGAGRLIRSRSDAGVVAILDGRISKKGYGKTFLNTLPAFERIYQKDKLEGFWQDRVAPALFD
jgi:ATP-dependent DNA helicase DinG